MSYQHYLYYAYDCSIIAGCILASVMVAFRKKIMTALAFPATVLFSYLLFGLLEWCYTPEGIIYSEFFDVIMGDPFFTIFMIAFQLPLLAMIFSVKGALNVRRLVPKTVLLFGFVFLSTFIAYNFACYVTETIYLLWAVIPLLTLPLILTRLEKNKEKYMCLACVGGGELIAIAFSVIFKGLIDKLYLFIWDETGGSLHIYHGDLLIELCALFIGVALSFGILLLADFIKIERIKNQ